VNVNQELRRLEDKIDQFHARAVGEILDTRQVDREVVAAVQRELEAVTFSDRNLVRKLVDQTRAEVDELVDRVDECHKLISKDQRAYIELVGKVDHAEAKCHWFDEDLADLKTIRTKVAVLLAYCKRDAATKKRRKELLLNILWPFRLLKKGD